MKRYLFSLSLYVVKNKIFQIYGLFLHPVLDSTVENIISIVK